MPHLAVSSWSLHRSLGQPAIYGPERTGALGSPPTKTADFSLLELPKRISGVGLTSLDLCHFHLLNGETGYLAELRVALQAAGVTLWSLLVDGGDINHPDHAAHDRDWIARWIPVAAALGARDVRVVAGKSAPSAEALQTSLAALKTLDAVARAHGVKLVIENWFPTASRPEHVLWLLEHMDGQLGLKIDFGNWSGPTKYEDLAAIAPFAESCHAKPRFVSPYVIEREDFERCLAITQAAKFDGPYALIYDDPAGVDEWRGLQSEKNLVEKYT